MSEVVQLRYGRGGLEVQLPAGADVLTGQDPPPLPDPGAAVAAALERPAGVEPLAALVRKRRPRRVAITISDITRPVPNRDILPAVLELLRVAGVEDSSVVVVIGTGMHRPSSEEEREWLVGKEILSRVRVVDHRADDPETMVEVCAAPPVRVNREFALADVRIVTGFIEPHFMAGFSGGRKGVCPALTDLETIRRFHSFETLEHPRARSGVLDGNPCHAIATEVARQVGVDCLINVALTRDHRIAGVYCGDLEQAHLVGCEEVSRWSTAWIEGDL